MNGGIDLRADGSDRALWAGAALVALAIHAGLLIQIAPRMPEREDMTPEADLVIEMMDLSGGAVTTAAPASEAVAAPERASLASAETERAAAAESVAAAEAGTERLAEAEGGTRMTALDPDRAEEARRDASLTPDGDGEVAAASEEDGRLEEAGDAGAALRAGTETAEAAEAERLAALPDDPDRGLAATGGETVEGTVAERMAGQGAAENAAQAEADRPETAPDELASLTEPETAPAPATDPARLAVPAEELALAGTEADALRGTEAERLSGTPLPSASAAVSEAAPARSSAAPAPRIAALPDAPAPPPVARPSTGLTVTTERQGGATGEPARIAALPDEPAASAPASPGPARLGALPDRTAPAPSGSGALAPAPTSSAPARLAASPEGAPRSPGSFTSATSATVSPVASGARVTAAPQGAAPTRLAPGTSAAAPSGDGPRRLAALPETPSAAPATTGSGSGASRLSALPEPERGDEGAAPPGTLAAPAPNDGVIDESERVRYAAMLTYLRDFEAPSTCFAALPVLGEETGTLTLDAFGETDAGLDSFRTGLEAAAGIAPGTFLRRVTDSQCAALRFVTHVGRYPEFGVYIDIAERNIVSGDQLEAAIRNTGGRNVHLLLIDDEGMVQVLDDFVSSRLGQREIAIGMNLTGGDVETEQLLMALTSPAPLETVRSLNGANAPRFFGRLEQEMDRKGLDLDAALVGFTVRLPD
ncbi:hypothetical protein RM543_04590 [Roseicyclus sp. F158]|uniref:Uncharacterized protein n=1 Tax=Tropicimonas omnivorans TaxID=3075590 RepID=A0ABU3DE17_9RHOB|nr:hypothetical protein [Roseicyclus sp. F158]MDT0681954.1 hypothetical protein [Roseicyclus sp. F158]